MKLLRLIEQLPEGELREEAQQWASKHGDDVAAAIADEAGPHCVVAMVALLGADNARRVVDITRKFLITANDLEAAGTECVKLILAEAQRYADGNALTLKPEQLEQLADRAARRHKGMLPETEANTAELLARFAKSGGGLEELARATKQAIRAALGVEMAGCVAKLLFFIGDAEARGLQPHQWLGSAAAEAGEACRVMTRSMAEELSMGHIAAESATFLDKACAALHKALLETMTADEILELWATRSTEALARPAPEPDSAQRPKMDIEHPDIVKRMRSYVVHLDESGIMAGALDKEWFGRVWCKPGDDEVEVALRMWDIGFSGTYLLVIAPQVGVSRESCFMAAYTLLADIWSKPSRAPTQTKQSSAAHMLELMGIPESRRGEFQKAMEKMIRDDLDDEDNPRPVTLLPDDVRRKVDELKEPLQLLEDAFEEVEQARGRGERVVDQHHLAELSEGLHKAGSAFADWWRDHGRAFFVLDAPQKAEHFIEDNGGCYDTRAVGYVAEGLGQLLAALSAESEEDFADAVAYGAERAANAMATHRILSSDGYGPALREVYDETADVVRARIPRDELAAALRVAVSARG